MRTTVHVPDELMAKVRERGGRVNVSKVLQDALVQLVECGHHGGLRCHRCGVDVDGRRLRDEALSGFYTDLMWELRVLVDHGEQPTAEGACRVVKRVAEGHAISAAARYPLPRPSKRRRRQLLAEAADEHRQLVEEEQRRRAA